jgi:group II intron reverse transcriptase/maturase
MARKNGKLKFTALLHHVTVELLRESYYCLKRQAAPGVDGVTWQEYGEGLEGRLTNLHGRIHRGAYRAQPSRRVWIPKPDGRQRPLGVAALEDKVVQHAVGKVLNQIWEEDFLGFSYGFRPGRGPQDALDALWVGIVRKKVNWIMDLDIRSFFDKLQHDWLVKFVEHRIGDRRIVRLIQKWLKAGVMEDGVWSETEAGTPQGAVISPLLSNVYLHYVLDQWSNRWRQTGRGDVTIVRYADDAILGFEHQDEAARYLRELKERLREFGLELNEEKTRLIRFGRFAALNRAERGEGKPEAFTFLGFQHICGKNRQGRFEVRRITDGKRRRKKLQELKQELRRRMHAPIAQVGGWMRSVLNGYYQYHAVPGNLAVLSRFRERAVRLWYRVLCQRSQRRPTWKKLGPIFDHWLPIPHLVHAYPDARFDARRRKGSDPR